MTLEQLLNKLIEKGWEPRWYDVSTLKVNIALHDCIIFDFRNWLITWCKYSINDLCSIESGLWKFVCENDLYVDWDFPSNPLTNLDIYIWDFRYWIMLSSILPDKEKFLLDNIKIDD